MEEAAEHDIIIGGSNLPSHTFRAGLIDECHLFLTPILVGGGKPYLPSSVRKALELLHERRFGNGLIFLRYQIKSG